MGIRAALLAFATMLVAIACESAPQASAPASITYYGEVEPILREHCTGCHRAGGAGPFELTSYAQASALAHESALMTREHRMPPWPAVTGDDCPSLVGSRRLDESEITVLGTWARTGAPEGVARTLPPQLPSAWGTLNHVDAVLRADAPYLPLLRSDDHRCFVLDPGIDVDQYLVAYAVRQGVAGIIHHIQLWAIDTREAEVELDSLDAAAAGPGYPCADSIGVDGRYVSVWAPSDPIRRHPPKTGMLLRSGHRMVIQIHYHDHGTGLPDQTAIELELADHVKLEASMWTLSQPDILLPPGQRDIGVRAALEVTGDQPYQLWGVRPHMHTLGSAARVSISDALGSRCLLSIPRWDPAWQLMYFYETPIELPIGSQLEVACSYDTTSKTQPVRYGLSTEDEMCFAFFYITQ